MLYGVLYTITTPLLGPSWDILFEKRVIGVIIDNENAAGSNDIQICCQSVQ